MYNQTFWKDHVTEHPKRRKIVDAGGGLSDLEDAQGIVFQKGTPMSAANFNNMEDGIQDATLAGAILAAGLRARDDAPVVFKQSNTRENIISGEKLSTLFGKIKKWFSDLKSVAFSGKYSDLTGTPTIPAAATDVPKGPGTASAGKGTTWARADHVHPAQTSVTGSSGSCTGNAATATKVGHKLTFTGGASGSYDGSDDKSVKIPSTLADLSNGVWKAGDTLTIDAAVASGYFTGSAKRCVIAVPIGKPCSAAGAAITTLTGTLRGVGGYVDSSGTNFLKSPYSVSVSIHGNSGLVVIQIDKTSAFTDATNNTVAVFNGDIALTFKASADEPMPGPEIFGDDAGVEGPSVTDGAEPAEKEAETV